MTTTINNEHKKLNVPNLRFKEFQGEWKKVRVSNLLDFYSTNSLSWEQLDYNNGKIKNLHYGLIHKGVPTMVDVACDYLPYIKEESMPKSFTLFKEGDVAFADASEDTNDVAKAIEVVNCDNQQIVSGLHTIHGRDNSEQTVIGYKGYAFASDSFHKQIRRIAQGTKVFSVSARNFDEVYIGIPSKEEQTKIAKLLIAIDKRIATQNKIIEKLQSLIKGIRNEVFGKLRKAVGFNAIIGDVLGYEQPQSYIVEDTEYVDEGTPVLTANKAFVLGYTSETEGIYDKGDCIIFDDFTLDCKYVDFPFKVKSSAIKILTAKNEELLRYTFEFLKYLNLSTDEHKRHYIAETQNQSFILPNAGVIEIIAHTFSALSLQMRYAVKQRIKYEEEKQYLLRQMFI